MCMCVCAYPSVEFPSRLTRRPYLLSKRRHCLVERTTKEPASTVLRTHAHIHTGLLCIYVSLLIQWRHVDRYLYCYLSMITIPYFQNNNLLQESWALIAIHVNEAILGQILYWYSKSLQLILQCHELSQW